jgi:hypothetical protein
MVESRNECHHSTRSTRCVAGKNHGDVAGSEFESRSESRDGSTAGGYLEGPRDARWQVRLLLAYHDDLRGIGFVKSINDTGKQRTALARKGELIEARTHFGKATRSAAGEHDRGV